MDAAELLLIASSSHSNYRLSIHHLRVDCIPSLGASRQHDPAECVSRMARTFYPYIASIAFFCWFEPRCCCTVLYLILALDGLNHYSFLLHV
jgi:hypothetical protein